MCPLHSLSLGRIMAHALFYEAFGIYEETGGGEYSGELLNECRRCKALAG